VSEAPGETRTRSRGLDLLTAVLLGIVSLTTALGAWQASTWTRQAADFAESSSDARDAAIIRGVSWQYDLRQDSASIFNARKYALLEDEATAAGDFQAQAYNNVMWNNYLARIVSDEGLKQSFQTWRDDGFPPDENPTTTPQYLVQLRGDADSYTVVSALSGTFKTALESKANVFVQAALIDALALFLLGVAGINRLRSARLVTLVLGAGAWFVSLIMMATAY
jgi:hypothetical protein